RVAQIPDGTSNTIMFGEMAGGFIAWGGSGGIPDGISGVSRMCGFNYSGWGGQPSNDINNWYGFSSRHDNIVNFGFGDGSALSITTNIHWITFVYLSGIQDGVVVTIDS